jgi:hypothetical protein
METEALPKGQSTLRVSPDVLRRNVAVLFRAVNVSEKTRLRAQTSWLPRICARRGDAAFPRCYELSARPAARLDQLEAQVEGRA